MKFHYCAAITLFMARPGTGWAQSSPSPTLPADTTGHTKGGYGKYIDRFYLGTLTKMDGTVIAAYLPSKRVGYERLIDYFLTAPAQGSWGGRHTLKMKKIRSMAVHGREYEVVQLNGKNTKIMAMRLLDGPISLLIYAEPRSIPIPIALGVGVAMPILGINLSDKNHWYLRRSGGALTEIRRARFGQLMSSYLQDNPALASKVAHQELHYQYNDTPAIVAEYNRSGPPSKP